LLERSAKASGIRPWFRLLSFLDLVGFLFRFGLKFSELRYLGGSFWICPIFFRTYGHATSKSNDDRLITLSTSCFVYLATKLLVGDSVGGSTVVTDNAHAFSP